VEEALLAVEVRMVVNTLDSVIMYPENRIKELRRAEAEHERLKVTR
jgi:hypothetical protein